MFQNCSLKGFIKEGFHSEMKICNKQVFCPLIQLWTSIFPKNVYNSSSIISGQNIWSSRPALFMLLHLHLWLLGYWVNSIILVCGWHNTGLRMTKYWSADDKILVYGWQNTGLWMTNYLLPGELETYFSKMENYG